MNRNKCRRCTGERNRNFAYNELWRNELELLSFSMYQRKICIEKLAGTVFYRKTLVCQYVITIDIHSIDVDKSLQPCIHLRSLHEYASND